MSKLRYAVVYEDENLIDSEGYYDTEAEAIQNWLELTGFESWEEAERSGSYGVHGFTAKEIREMPEE
jgi:hypothetical protein